LPAARQQALQYVALALMHTILAAATTLAPGWSLQQLLGLPSTTATSLQLTVAGAYLWLFAACLICLKVGKCNIWPVDPRADIMTRWASKRQSHSLKRYDSDTSRHDHLTSVQAQTYGSDAVCYAALAECHAFCTWRCSRGTCSMWSLVATSICGRVHLATSTIHIGY
jgi:hypothetical protein